jgi:hypothetical protein
VYSAVIDGLGRQLVETATWTVMQGSNFKSDCADLFKNKVGIVVDQSIQDAMFTDPYYGLNSLDNYGKYDQLMVHSSLLIMIGLHVSPLAKPV